MTAATRRGYATGPKKAVDGADATTAASDGDLGVARTVGDDDLAHAAPILELEPVVIGAALLAWRRWTTPPTAAMPRRHGWH